MEGVPWTRDEDGWFEVTGSYIEGQKVFGPEDEQSSAEDRSEQMWLTRLFVDLAADKARAQGLAPDSPETRGILDRAIRVANAITFAYSPVYADSSKEDVQRGMRMTWGVHPRNIREEVRSRGGMNVSSADLEHGVGVYLNSDLKDPRIDRLLVRALADMELSSFLNLQVGSPISLFDSPVQQASKSVVGGWIKGRLVALLITIALCAALLALKAYVPATPDFVVLGALALFAGGYLVITAISFVALLMHGRRISSERKALLETVKAAVDFYGEFYEPSGTISLAHYRRRLDEAKQAGIVWPQSLWALVDDMEHRGIRHF